VASVISSYPRPSGWSAAIAQAPFRALAQIVTMLTEANAHARALHRLNQRSDYELSGKGLTRDGEIRRILGVSATL
jgi:hypothetical protein